MVNLHRMPPPLPMKVKDWKRQIKTVRTLNDLVEDIHLVLAENQQYIDYLYATYDEQAVEGSLSCDNCKVAEMIRDKAKSMDSALANEKLATISKALGVVLRRYNQDRRTRRNTVGGEIVPNNNGVD